MRINVLNRPLFDSFLGIIDIKQGEHKAKADDSFLLALASLTLSFSPPSPGAILIILFGVRISHLLYQPLF
jgi:hypothetical protein